MKQLSFLIFLTFSLFSGVTYAVSWKIYHQSTSETIRIDESSIKRKGSYVSFWYVSDLKSYPDIHFLWKDVYDCKNKKQMVLFYEVVKSIKVLPKNIPDLTDEDRWSDITSTGWDRGVFQKLCEPTVKKTYF